MVPPEGFAVTDDPLESDLFDDRSGQAAGDPLDDELARLDDPGDLDLEWSPAQPRNEYESELPHWTDPPTGQVPAVLARDEPDLPEWQRAGDTGPVWREHRHDWADPGFEPSMLGDEGTQGRRAPHRGPRRRAQAVGVRRRRRGLRTMTQTRTPGVTDAPSSDVARPGGIPVR